MEASNPTPPSKPSTPPGAEAETSGATNTKPDPPQPNARPAKPASQPSFTETGETIAWQKTLLPLMRSLLISLAIFFFLTTIIQLGFMQWHIYHAPGLEASAPILTYESGKDSQESKLPIAQWNTLAGLEFAAMRNRYFQASIMSMGRIWVIYLGFITGMILALVGAGFILGKIREPVSKFGIENGTGLKSSFESASPGLALAFLGTLLMLTTMLARADVEVKDGPQYVKPAVAPLGVAETTGAGAADNGTTDNATEAEKSKQAYEKARQELIAALNGLKTSGDKKGASAASASQIEGLLKRVEAEMKNSDPKTKKSDSKKTRGR